MEEEADECEATPEDAFVEEALQAERDISLFPIGSHRYLEELVALQKDVNDRSQRYMKPNEGKGVAFASAKKLYETNLFQSSEDFK